MKSTILKCQKKKNFILQNLTHKDVNLSHMNLNIHIIGFENLKLELKNMYDIRNTEIPIYCNNMFKEIIKGDRQM